MEIEAVVRIPVMLSDKGFCVKELSSQPWAKMRTLLGGYCVVLKKMTDDDRSNWSWEHENEYNDDGCMKHYYIKIEKKDKE